MTDSPAIPITGDLAELVRRLRAAGLSSGQALACIASTFVQVFAAVTAHLSPAGQDYGLEQFFTGMRTELAQIQAERQEGPPC